MVFLEIPNVPKETVFVEKVTNSVSQNTKSDNLGGFPKSDHIQVIHINVFIIFTAHK